MECNIIKVNQHTVPTSSASQPPKECLLVNLSERFHWTFPFSEPMSQEAPENSNRESNGSTNKTQPAEQPTSVSTQIHRSAALFPTKLIS